MRELIKEIINNYINETRKIWTDEKLRDEAKKYKTKAEFQKNSPNAYQTAIKKGKEFWGDITSHMTNLHKSWTDDTLKQEALKYKTPAEFYHNNPSAYRLSLNRGDEFYRDATEHMTRLTNWTEENIKNEALKYETKPEFRDNNPSAYMAADRLGIMDEVTSHMIPVGSRYKRLIYAYEFPDNSVYVGLTYDMNKRDYSHMNRESSAVYQYMLNTGLKPIKKTLTKFMDKTEASKMEGEIEKQYRDKGWTILNRAKTGTLGGDILIWKPEKIRQLFLQYDDLTKLYNEQPSAIQAAKRQGMDFYKDVTSHIARKHNKWTDDMLRDEALKYKTRQEFRDSNQKAYQASKTRGDEFYNDITSHMEYQRNQWTNDLLRQEALKHKTKNEFAKQNPTAYKLSKDRGDVFFNEITSHMPKRVNQWTDEMINNELSKYGDYSEFLKNSKLYSVLKHQKKLQLAKDYYTS
jgi:hypothetical protein